MKDTDERSILGTEDVQNMLVNCCGKHLHCTGNEVHFEDPAGFLLWTSFLSGMYLPKQCFPAVTQTLSPTAGSYSSKNISQFSHW